MTDAFHFDSSASPSPKKPVRSQTNRRDRLDRIRRVAALQSGVVTRRQLRALDWTDTHIDHELDYGRWQRPARGCVVLHTGDLTDEQRLWLGVLHAGHGAALSHLTAVRRAGLRWVGPETIDVLTPKGDLVAPLPGYFFHQTRRPYDRWLVEHDELRGPPRLRVEHAALLTAERDHHLRRGAGLLAACVQQNLTDVDRLQRAIPQIRKLRHGHFFSLMLGDIAGGAQSFAEIDLGRLCRAGGLASPHRQAIRVDKQGCRRYLDCEWRLAGGRTVVLEIDGSFHREVENWWRDMKRERAVVLSTSTVLRCSSVELRLQPRDVLDDLIAAGVPRTHRFVHASSA